MCSKGQVWTTAALCGQDIISTMNGTEVVITPPIPQFDNYTTNPVFFLNVPPVQCYRGGAWVKADPTVVATASQSTATRYVNANAAPGGVAAPAGALAAGAILALLF